MLCKQHPPSTLYVNWTFRYSFLRPHYFLPIQNRLMVFKGGRKKNCDKKTTLSIIIALALVFLYL